MKIVLQLADGTRDVYEQPDSAAQKEIIDNLNHQHFFKPETLAFELDLGLRIYSTASIVRIDLASDQLPDWQMLGDEDRIDEITPEEFHGIYTPMWDPKLFRDAERKAGEEFFGFARILLKSADPVYLRIKGKVGAGFADRVIAKRVLSSEALYFVNVAGGRSIVNRAYAMRIDLLPGRPGIMPEAWKVNRAN